MRVDEKSIWIRSKKRPFNKPGLPLALIHFLSRVKADPFFDELLRDANAVNSDKTEYR